MATPLVTADTSLIVASLLQWHPLHARAAALLREVRRVPAHALAESFSVLTRLPAQRALRPDLAIRALHGAFPEEPWSLSPAGYQSTLSRLAEAGWGGGRVYDAVIGGTAAEGGARLLSADRRALPTYALVGAAYELVD
ncbi:MAG: PIN domain-containing protein [Chloroflexi bacterium]|nr:PIN domain-containing protein [Chloroflexota bacterium]